MSVHPVRNSKGTFEAAGIILQCSHAAEQRGIVSNGVNRLKRNRGVYGEYR